MDEYAAAHLQTDHSVTVDSSVEDPLRRLVELHELLLRGLITSSDYEEIRAQLLGLI